MAFNADFGHDYATQAYNAFQDGDYLFAGLSWYCMIMEADTNIIALPFTMDANSPRALYVAEESSSAVVNAFTKMYQFFGGKYGAASAATQGAVQGGYAGISAYNNRDMDGWDVLVASGAGFGAAYLSGGFSSYGNTIDPYKRAIGLFAIGFGFQAGLGVYEDQSFGEITLKSGYMGLANVAVGASTCKMHSWQANGRTPRQYNAYMGWSDSIAIDHVAGGLGNMYGAFPLWLYDYQKRR